MNGRPSIGATLRSSGPCTCPEPSAAGRLALGWVAVAEIKRDFRRPGSKGPGIIFLSVDTRLRCSLSESAPMRRPGDSARAGTLSRDPHRQDGAAPFRQGEGRAIPVVIGAGVRHCLARSIPCGSQRGQGVLQTANRFVVRDAVRHGVLDLAGADARLPLLELGP
jgi:hypothetical protein